MKDWAAYTGAFACGLGAAALCYFAGFYAVMSGGSLGIAGFFALVLVVPMIAGFITFGATYYGLTGHGFDMAGWAQGFAFVVLVVALTFGLVSANIFAGPVAMYFFVALLFVGGRWMIQRAARV